jgi:hypothetical protein
MTNYEEYVSEQIQINKSIDGQKISTSTIYSEYVAEQVDRNISYTEYLSGMYDTKNVKRKKKIKNLFK